MMNFLIQKHSLLQNYSFFVKKFGGRGARGSRARDSNKYLNLLKHPLADLYKKEFVKNLGKCTANHSHVTESLFNKVAGLSPATLLKKTPA